ncbi:hypothetical protein GQ607_012210 [Colletotrichum asianum]|uniref:Uncharacterized protein n=1 Tax=Colletotrichum asianum TaxID=702518 RepID=A0A8H3W515_9PEZI|nr:hypothetical protein GQ607_012210 [Colletotrichum asianum]
MAVGGCWGAPALASEHPKSLLVGVQRAESLQVHWRADCACEPPAPSKQVCESDDTSPVQSSPVGTWDAAMDALDEMRCDLACPPSPLQGKWGKGPPHVPAMSMFFPSIHPSIHEPMSICPPSRLCPPSSQPALVGGRARLRRTGHWKHKSSALL